MEIGILLEPLFSVLFLMKSFWMRAGNLKTLEPPENLVLAFNCHMFWWVQLVFLLGYICRCYCMLSAL